MLDNQEFVELGLACADTCMALSRGLVNKQLDDLSQSMLEAIRQLAE
jgi:hypothetical protein